MPSIKESIYEHQERCEEKNDKRYAPYDAWIVAKWIISLIGVFITAYLISLLK